MIGSILFPFCASLVLAFMCIHGSISWAAADCLFIVLIALVYFDIEQAALLYNLLFI